MSSKKQSIKSKNTTKRKLPKKNKLNCNPNIKDGVVRGSCLPVNILHILKKSYNDNNPGNEIISETPRNIWKDLKKRLRTCVKEDCWLDVISDKTYREKLEKYLFIPRPLQPISWSTNPNMWLTNYDIDKVLAEYQESYPHFKAIQTASIDFAEICYIEDLCKLENKQELIELIESGKNKIGVVFNLDKFEEKGSHWVSLFIDLQDNFIFYFDSNGDRIPKQIKTFVEIIKKSCSQLDNPIELQYYNNYKVEHQLENSECGMYSLFFIITMLTGKLNNIQFKSLDDKINLFREPRIPDNYVNKFRDIYFEVHNL
jgi:hypothetical protein